MNDLTGDSKEDPYKELKAQWESEETQLKQRHHLSDHELTFQITPIDNNDYTLDGLTHIGGVDLSFPLNNTTDAIACYVILSYPALECVYEAFLETKLTLPYIAGRLAMRESPSLLQLIEQQHLVRPDLDPQVLLVDGNGTLHPRRFGLACHLGVRSGLPTIGVGKKFLQIDGEGEIMTMDYVRKLHIANAGETIELKGENSGFVYGAALRTRVEAPNPILVSRGHRVSMETALKVVRKCCLYRVPEPVRQADMRGREYIRKKWEDKGTAIQN